MWWFLKRARAPAKGQAQPQGISPRIRTEEELLARVPDLASLAGQDVAIKVWLPELVARTLKWMADYEGVSQSNWVRARLSLYLYGSAAMLAQQIREERANRARAERGDDAPRFSRSPVDRSSGRWVYLVPQLGKNTVAFKLWIGQQMRDDLMVLAKHAGVGFSPFIREAIIGDLLGRGSLPERPAIMGMPTDAATAWERDEEVPLETVEEGAFGGLGEAELIWLKDRTSNLS